MLTYDIYYMLTMKEHLEYSNWNKCPICDLKYNAHWKILNHIRKTKDQKHQNYLKDQIKEAINIYENSERQKFHFNLNIKNNIYSGISFKTFDICLKEVYSKEHLSEIRKERISKTMSKTKKTKEHNNNVSLSMKKAWREGKFNSEKTIEARKIGYASRKSFSGKNNPMFGKPAPKGSGSGISGFRKDINLYVRSTWEANFARILLYLNIEFEYENNVFYFNIENNSHSYRPDFFIKRKNMYYEIKGHAKSRKEWVCDCKGCNKTRNGILHIKQKGYKIKIIGKKEYNRILKKFYKNIKDNIEK